MSRKFLTAVTAVMTAGLLGGLGVPSAVGNAAPLPVDRDFVMAVHQGNLVEIATGQDAQYHATTTCVRNVGAILVRDHMKLDADLRNLAAQEAVRLPAMPTSAQQQAMRALQQRAGSHDYDRAWLELQDAGHIAVLAMIDHQIAQGHDARITDAARKARPIVDAHLAMVRGGTCHAMH